MTLPSFASLKNTGHPLRDVRQFLRSAGRLDTLRHSAQVNAAGRQLARRLGFPDLGAVDLACSAHDLAAPVPLRGMVAAAEALGVPLTEADRAILAGAEEERER